VDPKLLLRSQASVRVVESALEPRVSEQLPGFIIKSVSQPKGQINAMRNREVYCVCLGLAGALVLAFVTCIGLYGALTHFVESRRRDIAIRMCCGASVVSISCSVLSRAAWCIVAALLLTVSACPFLIRLSTGTFLGQMSWSTAQTVLIMLTGIGISLAVSLIPAYAAMSVSPSSLLKED
jgi:ABC-type antimicrobial peptide transport system permease subunit